MGAILYNNRTAEDSSRRPKPAAAPAAGGDQTKMTKIFNAAAFVLAFAALALTSARADALEFSAEFREKLGDEVREGKIYVTADKSRYEVEGADTIEITRADQKVMWVIFPKRRVYVEEEFWGFPLGTSLENSGERSGGGDLTREDLGYETIDTFRLKKYLVTVKYNGGETEDKYYEWYRSDFPIPVKTESLNGYMSYEYRRIKFTTLDPNLFNPPKRYKKITTEQLIELEKQWERSEKKGKKK